MAGPAFHFRSGPTGVNGYVLARADADRLGCYLESSNPRNLPFYRRIGFVETGRLPTAPGVSDVVLMWRDPRPA